MDVVHFTKTYNSQSLNQEALIIHRESLVIKKRDEKMFSLEEVTTCKQALQPNKTNIKRYNLGELGVQELIREFKKYV